MEQVSAALLDWAMASAPLPGGEELGDVCLVRELPGAAVVAVVDGLGHGHEAARAARQALELLERYIAEPPTPALRPGSGPRRSRPSASPTASWPSTRPAPTRRSWPSCGTGESTDEREDALVSAPVLDLEERCRSTLESLLEAGDEHALHQAYE